jgi:hypothetical protein
MSCRNEVHLYRPRGPVGSSQKGCLRTSLRGRRLGKCRRPFIHTVQSNRGPHNFAILALLVALVVFGVTARASPSCPTLAEARAAYPSKYLYWHTARHCWNATPGRRRHDAPTPVPAARPDKTPMLLYPTLVQSGAELDPAFLAPEPASAGPLLLDVDEITAGPIDEPSAAEAETNFRDRWSVMPAAWFMARKD